MKYRRRDFLRATASTFVLASLAVGWWGVRTTATDGTAAQRADRQRAVVRRDTRAIEARRSSTRVTIAALEASLHARTADRDALAVSLSVVTGQLNEAQAALSREAAGLQARDSRVGALRRCLQGVSGALNALAVGDAGTAITRLRSVGSDCDAAA